MLWASIGNWWQIVSNSKLKGCWMRPKAKARICWMKTIAKAYKHLLTISSFPFLNHYSSCISSRFEMVRFEGAPLDTNITLIPTNLQLPVLFTQTLCSKNLLFQHLTLIDYKSFFTPPIYDMVIKTHNKMSQYQHM